MGEASCSNLTGEYNIYLLNISLSMYVHNCNNICTYKTILSVLNIKMFENIIEIFIVTFIEYL